MYVTVNLKHAPFVESKSAKKKVKRNLYVKKYNDNNLVLERTSQAI